MKLLFSILFFSLAAPVYAWTLHADFESGELGTKAEGVDNAFSGAAGRSLYTNEEVLRGSLSARMEILEGETGYGMWGGDFTFPSRAYKGETIWFLVHTYMPQGFDHYSYSSGNRLKFMRIHTASADGNNLGYNDLYFDYKGDKNPLSFIYEGGGDWVDMGGLAEFPKFNSWESYEMAVTLDNVSVDDGGEGEVKIWKNGILLSHITNRFTLKHADAYATKALLFTYWNGGSPSTQHMYADEITVTNERPQNQDAAGNYYLKGLIADRRPKMTPATIE